MKSEGPAPPAPRGMLLSAAAAQRLLGAPVAGMAPGTGEDGPASLAIEESRCRSART